MYIIYDNRDKDATVLFQRNSAFEKLRDWGMSEKGANELLNKAVELRGETIINGCFEAVYKPIGGIYD